MIKYIFIVVNLFVINVYCGKPLGVSLERASFYDISKPFACLDGSGVIPFELVNDDYCDCRDGSDEPGTNACMNSVFTCDNPGYIPTSIPSSRVNDGICDCCDGSDEYKQRTKCENTCNALAQKMREEQEKTKKLLEVGLAKKKELIQEGSEMKKQIRAKLEELESKRINLENDRKVLEEAKNKAEEKSKEAVDAQEKIWQEEDRIRAEKEKVENSTRLFTALDVNGDGILSAEELKLHNELDILFDNDGEFTLEEAQKLIDQNEKLDKDLFLQQYFDKISPHIIIPTSEQKGVEEPKPVEQEGEQEGEHTHEHEHEGEGHEEHGEESEQATTTARPPVYDRRNQYDEKTQAIVDEAEKARTAFVDVERDLTSLNSEIDNNKKKLEYDVGAQEEFASMFDKCFEYEDREYIYKLCPFDRCTQKSKSSHSETNLGTWQSWDTENESDKYKVMKFTNGLSCWNGPSRSTTVLLGCGIENKLTGVSEPNRCEYEMTFETPAVCDESILSQQKHDEL